MSTPYPCLSRRNQRLALILFSFIFLSLFTLPASAQTAAHAGGTIALGSGFSLPHRVAVDGSGNVYVTEESGNGVKKILAAGGYTTVVMLGSGSFNGPAGPYGVAVDGSGNVFVADFDNNAVKEIVAADSTVKTLVSGWPLYSPTGVALDGSGNIFVSNWNGPVVEIVAAGGYQTVNQLPGTYHANNIAVDGSGNVYLAISSGSSVSEILAAGGYTTVEMLGSGFNGPNGVAVDSSGNVYVAEMSGNAVKEIIAVNGSIPSSPTIKTLGTGFNLPDAVAVDGSGNVYVSDYGNHEVKKIITGGAVKLSTTPVGSTSGAVSILFTFDSGGTIGAPVVLTQGATGLDFTDAGTGTCTTTYTSNPLHSYNAGEQCTVDITFKPKYPGQRLGAVQLVNSSGTVIATNLIYGNGTGPQVTFPSNTTLTSLGGGFSSPIALAADAGGNIYVADFGTNSVKEIPPGCGDATCVKRLGGGFSGPGGVAVDGSGNVYVGDYVTSSVKEIPLGCVTAACVKTLGGGFFGPNGVAVDGSGNVYVTDYGHNLVKLIPPGCVTATCVETLGGSFSGPNGVAVDGSSNVYVTGFNDNRVQEITAASGHTTANTLGGGFSSPIGVTVDSSGNVYIADYVNNALKKIPSGCGDATCVKTLGGGFSYPGGVAVDGSGSVYIANLGNDSVKQLDLSDAPGNNGVPALGFASTNVGSTSSDSPRTVTVANIGNADLNFPVPSSGNNPSIGNYFSLDSSGSTACPLVTSSPGTLASGASCTLAISFVPTDVGNINSELKLTDDNLNVPAPSYATQSIALRGIATPATTTTTAASQTVTYSPGTQSVTLPAMVSSTGGDVNEGTVTFTVTDGGATIGSATTSATVSNGNASVVYSLPGGTTAKSYAIQAVYNPATTNPDFQTSSDTTQSLTINQATATVTLGSLSPTYNGSPRAATATTNPSGLAVTFTYEGLPTPPTNAGSYAVVGTVNDANYQGRATDTLVINGANASVTPTAAGKTYGASDPTLTGTLSGFISTDNVTASYTRSAGETVAGGPYTISATLAPTGVLANYNVTYNTAQFTINKANASVTPNAASKTYGASDPIFSGTLSGFVAGDNVTASYTRSAGETVAGGPYTISATLTPAGVLANYNVTYNTAQFAINKANASVTPNVASKTYGASDPTLTGTLSGFISSDNVTASYTRAAGETVAGSPYTISATLAPAGVLANYNLTYNAAQFTINKAALTVTASNAAMSYGASLPSLAGTLTGVVNGDGITASYSTTATSTSTPGNYSITVTLNDPTGKLGNYTVISTNATLTVNKANSTVAIQTNAATVFLKNNVALSAKVTSTTSGTPTGTVTFMEGTTSLGGATLDNTGTANLTLSTLAAGVHNLTAVYGGDVNFNGVTSAALSQTVQDFQLNVAGGAGTILSATVLPGGVATYQFQVSPTNGTTFPAAITLTLTGLPAGATYTITPATLPAGSGAQQVTVQVQTAKLIAGLRNPVSSSPGSGLAVLGLLLPLGMVSLRAAKRSRTKQIAVILWLLLLVSGVLGMVGCGNGGAGFLSQSPQTYTLPLNATSGALQHSVNLSLTIQ